MKSETLTRYLLHQQGTPTFMNVLLDRDDLIPGTSLTLKDNDDADAVWIVKARHETIKRASVKRDWKNNI